jgi:hypothetical protein
MSRAYFSGTTKLEEAPRESDDCKLHLSVEEGTRGGQPFGRNGRGQARRLPEKMLDSRRKKKLSGL